MHTLLLKFSVEDEQQYAGGGLLLGALKLGRAQSDLLYNQVSLPSLSDGIASRPTVTNQKSLPSPRSSLNRYI